MNAYFPNKPAKRINLTLKNIQGIAESYKDKVKMLILNKQKLTAKNKPSIKNSTKNYLNLSRYSTRIKLLTSIRNKKQIILKSKKIKTLTQSRLALKLNKQKNKLRYFKRVDMLNYANAIKNRMEANLNSKFKNYKYDPELEGYTNKITPYFNNILSKKFDLDIAKSQNIIYKFNNKKTVLNYNLNKNISTIIENSFITMSSLISKPVFNITPYKVVIHLFFFLIDLNKKANNRFNFKNRFKNRFKNKFKKSNFFTTTRKNYGPKFLTLNDNKKRLGILCANLSKIFNKPVELDIVKLYSPINDSNILANVLGRISDISYKPYIFILDKIFSNGRIKNPTIRIPEQKSSIPSFITGIKIRLAGRLLKNRIIPRHTVKTTQHGSLTRSSAEIVSKARFTSKNKRGTFSFTTSIGHRFF